LWSPEINKGIFAGQSGSAVDIWTFDPTAPTPKLAWNVVSSAAQTGEHGVAYASFCMMTDTEVYWWNNLVVMGGHVLNPKTGLRRTPSRPADPFTSRVGSIASYSYLRRASTASTSKVWYTDFRNVDGVQGMSRYHVRSYDPRTGVQSTMDAGNAFPDWWLMVKDGKFAGHQYRTIALASGPWGERIVGYAGVAKGPFDPREAYGVFCYDPATNRMVDYTSPADPKPTGSVNGTPAQRWQFVPQVKAFVALLKHTDNVWVFRPPATWGIT
jgi:hypothetical protein